MYVSLCSYLSLPLPLPPCLPRPLLSHTHYLSGATSHSCLTRGRAQNYPGWDEGWLTIVKTRIQMEEEVVEDIAELKLEGVDAESQVS